MNSHFFVSDARNIPIFYITIINILLLNINSVVNKSAMMFTLFILIKNSFSD